MGRTTRRQFVQQTALATAALCGRPLHAIEARGIFAARGQNPAAIDSAAVRKLATQVAGRIITPQASDYESARLVYNRAFDRHPALIVRCAALPMWHERSILYRPIICHRQCVAAATTAPDSAYAIAEWSSICPL